MMHNLAVVTSAISSVQMIRVRRYFNLIINANRRSARCGAVSSCYRQNIYISRAAMLVLVVWV